MDSSSVILLLVFLGAILFGCYKWDKSIKAAAQKTQPRSPSRSRATSFSHQQYENDYRIYDESFTICSNTKSLDTLFSRYDVAMDALARIKSRNVPNSIDADEFAAILENSRSALIGNCINRSYDDILEKANALKTERGRQAKITKFFTDILDKHSSQLNDNHIEQIYMLASDSGITLSASDASSNA